MKVGQKPKENTIFIVPDSPEKKVENATDKTPKLVHVETPQETPLVQHFTASTPVRDEHPEELNLTPLNSPVTITLGIEEHGAVSPIRRDLTNLFEVRPILSPLRRTPQKLKSNNVTTNIKPKQRPSATITRPDQDTVDVEVIEQTRKSESTNKPESKVVKDHRQDQRTVVKKRDAKHLELPSEDSSRNKKSRFMAPPSMFQASPEAARAMIIREKAKSADTYINTILPTGYGGVKKVEKAILPDGTIYELTAYWMPDPECIVKKQETVISVEVEEDKPQDITTLSSSSSSSSASSSSSTAEMASAAVQATVTTETKETQTGSFRVEIIHDC